MVKKNVLIVDDEHLILELCTRFLTNAGYQVTSTSSGGEAVQLCQKGHFDLILSDVRMPGMNGLELVKTIKQVQPQIVVVIMTGHGTIQTAIEALKQGALGFLLKPFTEEELLKAIEYASGMNEMVRENLRMKSLMGLFEINQSLMKEVHLDTLLPKILEVAQRETKAGRGSLMLLEKETRELVVKAHSGFDTVFPEKMRKKLGEWVSGKVALTGEPIILMGKETADPDLAQHLQNQEIQSSLTVPLMANKQVIGILNLAKTKESPPFTESDMELASILGGISAAAIGNATLYDRINKNYLKTIETLLSAMEVRDVYKQGHSTRVSMISKMLAEEMKIPPKQTEDIALAGLLHDIGKIGMQDSLLQKDGRLDDQETEMMQGHPANAVKILQPIELSEAVLDFVHSHHEWWNGTGYPRKLKENQISLGARILAVADTVDAMMNSRVNRKAYTYETLCEELKRFSGTQFDPAVISVFLAMVEKMGLEAFLRRLKLEASVAAAR